MIRTNINPPSIKASFSKEQGHDFFQTVIFGRRLKMCSLINLA
jgi:hypothetical protein